MGTPGARRPQQSFTHRRIVSGLSNQSRVKSVRAGASASQDGMSVRRAVGMEQKCVVRAHAR